MTQMDRALGDDVVPRHDDYSMRGACEVTLRRVARSTQRRESHEKEHQVAVECLNLFYSRSRESAGNDRIRLQKYFFGYHRQTVTITCHHLLDTITFVPLFRNVLALIVDFLGNSRVVLLPFFLALPMIPILPCLNVEVDTYKLCSEQSEHLYSKSSDPGAWRAPGDD